MRSRVASSAQVVEPVDVDGRAVGADGDDDEVAVPGRELLELRQQLLALGAALGALHALLGLARRQLEALHLDLLEVLRLRATCVRVRDQRPRGVARLEAVGVDGAGLGDQRRAALGGVAVEQPLEPVEPPRRDARERGPPLVVELGRARRERVAHRALRQPPERDELAARADRLRRSGRGCRRRARSPRTAEAPPGP